MALQLAVVQDTMDCMAQHTVRGTYRPICTTVE